MLLLLSFCFTFQGFKQNIEGPDSELRTDIDGGGLEYNVLDTVRSPDDSCIEFTRIDKSVCDSDAANSLMNKTVVKVSPSRKPSCKSIETEESLRSSALNITMDSYTIERLAVPGPEGCLTDEFILTVESFSAMIERIRQKSVGPDAIGEPSASHSESDEKPLPRTRLWERIRKARETA